MLSGARDNIEDGQEKVLELRFGAEPIRLPGREEPLLLVVIAGWKQDPLLLSSILRECGTRHRYGGSCESISTAGKLRKRFASSNRAIRYPDSALSPIEKPDGACDGSGLLRGDLLGEETEVEHPVRKTAHHLAALLPAYCPSPFMRWSTEPALS